MAIIHYSFKSIGAFITESQYEIPQYQRGYSWEKEQLEDLWNDLLQLYEDPDLTEHFLGQIVIHQENRTKYIIDGQQRTSTSIILLDAFRRVFTELCEKNEKEDEAVKTARKIIEEINVTYIPSGRGPRSKVRLTMGEADKNIFENYIQKDIDEKYKIIKKDLKKTEALILQASYYFYNKLFEFSLSFENLEEQIEELVKLFDEFLENITVMYVETDNLNEAFIIFESLNARGKSLETSDLLKNHLFRIGTYNLEEIKKNWSNMLVNLEKVDVTSYIRVLWNAQNTFVTKARLYTSMRSKIDNAEKSLIFSNQLLKYSNLYAALVLPKEEIYFKSDALNKSILNLSNIGAKTYYPIIFALTIKEFSEEQILKIISSIEVLLVRNVVVGGASSNSLEKEFARIANKINFESETLHGIIEEIKSLTISDQEFINSFSTFTIKKPESIRYLFRAIENYEENEVQVIEDNRKVHIEHIMPKKSQNWGVLKEEHAQYVNRFGNLTLLGDEYNRNATNFNFDKKKIVYEKSNIKITQKLKEKSHWGPIEIENRQKELAKIAVNIWPK